MTNNSFENLQVYQLSENLADEIWKIVAGWDSFAANTFGMQIVKSADSIGANIAEGTGRGSYVDNKRFVNIARGSLYETKHWLRRAVKRNYLTNQQAETLRSLINELAPRLNAYLNSIAKNCNQSKINQNKGNRRHPQQITNNK